MNEQEARLKQLDGPSSTTKARQKRYVTDSKYRADVDAADKANGTTDGPWLRAGYFGTKQLEASAPVAKQSAVELAKDVKEFPLARCHEIFRRDANTPGESYKDLTPDQYQSAKRAAKFLGVLPNDGSEASVKYIYSTSRDRAAAREAKEAAAKDSERKQSETIPPGVQRDEKGQLILTDEQAFTKWKASKSEHADAVKFLEDSAA